MKVLINENCTTFQSQFSSLKLLHRFGTFSLVVLEEGGQGWRSGESTHLPPMWPGFDSQT